LYTVYTPREPNITYFELGQQSIVFFPPEDEAYTTISVSSSDFVVTPSSRSIPGDTSFFIQGNSSGIKNFTVTVSGENGSYSYDSSIVISSNEVEIDGPYILTDFNFSNFYSSPQTIDFYCLGSRYHPTECIKETKFVFDGNEFDYNFGDKITFNFLGTKQITFYAKNTFGKESIRVFSLTINEPLVESVQENVPTSPTITSGGSSTTSNSTTVTNTTPQVVVPQENPTETISTGSSSVINPNNVFSNNNNSTKIINNIENLFNPKEPTPVEERTNTFSNPVSSNNVLKKQFDLAFLKLENQFEGVTFESNIIKGFISSIEENKHKNSIFITLVAIIILLGLVLILPERKVKK